uniref:Uncharacterized protein n=1 Tax=Brassica oleracea TaxID=3712 RepID=Q2A9G9_BRAOL|nr:hypothetical protein 27.t00052 [Brassica oleracea]
MELKRTAMWIKSSLSSIIPKNLQAGYKNPQLLLSELAGRYKETGPVSSSDEMVVLANTDTYLPGSKFATVLHEKLVASGVEPKVVVATNVNPKLVGGCVFLDATLGTYFYFDTESALARTFLKLKYDGDHSEIHYVHIGGAWSLTDPLAERVLDRHIGWVSVYELNMVELTRSRVTVVDLAVG